MPSTTFKPRTDDRQIEATGRLAYVGRADKGANNWCCRIVSPAVILTILLSAFFFLQCFLPLRTAILIGADEGFELAKATLCLKGYRLYADVWNDQPPLHTFLITQVLKQLTPSILGPRLMTSVFAAILLSSAFFISLRVSGLFIAALTATLLIASPGFIELSASCMLEIPALAPTVAALGVLLVGRQSKWHVLEIIAGLFLGIAFQIKLVSVILLPLAALIVWLRQRELTLQRNASVPPTTLRGRDGRAALFRSFLFFGASLAIGFVAIDYLIDRGAFLLHFQQSWSSHFASAKSFEYGSAAEHPFEWNIFLKNWDTTVPALLGIVFLLRTECVALRTRGRMTTRQGSSSRRRSPGSESGERVPAGRARGYSGRAGKVAFDIVPFAWLVLTLSVFATHRPWWSYYYIHFAIPLCWCAAIGISTAWQWIHRRRQMGLSSLLGAFAVCAATWMGSRVYLQISGIRHSPQTYKSLLLGQIERLKPFAKYIYTDESIYSFHAGIPMPPDLAVVPLKRLWSGDLTNARVAEKMQEVQPEVILLRNDTREVPFQDLINAEYRVVYQDADHRLYTKKVLAKQAGY